MYSWLLWAVLSFHHNFKENITIFCYYFRRKIVKILMCGNSLQLYVITTTSRVRKIFRLRVANFNTNWNFKTFKRPTVSLRPHKIGVQCSFIILDGHNFVVNNHLKSYPIVDDKKKNCFLLYFAIDLFAILDATYYKKYIYIYIMRQSISPNPHWMGTLCIFKRKNTFFLWIIFVIFIKFNYNCFWMNNIDTK